MLDNIIGNMLGKLVGKYLDGYTTAIGSVCTLLYLVVVVYGKIWPEHAIVHGVDLTYEQIFGMASVAVAGLGVAKKGYKAGLVAAAPVCIPNVVVPLGEGIGYAPMPVTPANVQAEININKVIRDPLGAEKHD